MRLLPTEPRRKLARSSEGSSIFLLKKRTLLPNHLTLMSQFWWGPCHNWQNSFFRWKLLVHIQKCKLECVSFTGKKLITCNSCLWHSSTLVCSPSSGQRGWFLMVTSFVFCRVCTNNLRVYISDKGTPTSWVFIFHLKCKRLQNWTYTL